MNTIQQSQVGYCCNPFIYFLVEKFIASRRFLQLGTGALEAAIALPKKLSNATIPATPVNQSNTVADAIYIEVLETIKEGQTIYKKEV